MSVCENQSTFQNNALLLLVIQILIHFYALTLQVKETSQLGCAEFLFSVNSTYSRYITLVHPWIELKQGVYRDFEFSGLVLIDICACLDKGHLISEGNFCVFKSSKKRPNI